MTRLVSNIYEKGPAVPEASSWEVRGEAARRARAALWHRLGLAVIDPEDVHDELERQLVIGLAKWVFGLLRRG